MKSKRSDITALYKIRKTDGEKYDKSVVVDFLTFMSFGG